MKTCKRLGIKTVAVYSEADASAVSFFLLRVQQISVTLNSKVYDGHILNCKLNFAYLLEIIFYIGYSIVKKDDVKTSD